MTTFRPRLWTTAGAALLLAACSAKDNAATAPAGSDAPVAAAAGIDAGPA